MLKKILYLSLISLLLTSTLIQAAQAETPNPNEAVFQLVLDKDTFFDPEIITFDLKINTASATVNAVSVLLDFNPTNLTLLATSTKGSLCTFVTNEEADNESGLYRLGCGTPIPNTLNQAQIMRLVFKKNTAGSTTLRLAGESEVFLADGMGTRLETVNEDYSIAIIK